MVVKGGKKFDDHFHTPCWRWCKSLVSREQSLPCQKRTWDSQNHGDSDHLQPAADWLLSQSSEVLWRNWPQRSFYSFLLSSLFPVATPFACSCPPTCSLRSHLSQSLRLIITHFPLLLIPPTPSSLIFVASFLFSIFFLLYFHFNTSTLHQAAPPPLTNLLSLLHTQTWLTPPQALWRVCMCKVS